MFKKILVANRGEIAMRIIRACRELNIPTVAIYSEADSTGIYVKKADEAYQVGPGPVKGFLDGPQIVALAKRVGADAIHPGYGFLAENAEFASLCQASDITFIGPSPQAIHLMGNKVEARKLAESVGVPSLPASVHDMQVPPQSASQQMPPDGSQVPLWHSPSPVHGAPSALLATQTVSAQ